MNRIDFYMWTLEQKWPKKIYTDNLCRLQQVEHSISNCDLDEEYYKDKCKSILELFIKLGKNEKMASRHIGNLPIGKNYMSSYTSAIRKYVLCMDYVVKKTNQQLNIK